MTKTMAFGTATILAGFACLSPVQAHHSSSMFDLLQPVWVKATVVRYDRVNPHTRIMLEETTEQGQTIAWIVEGPPLFRLVQRGTESEVTIGDFIAVCGFPLKDDASIRAAYADFGQSRFVHGHVLVMPDGEKTTWGSYGSLGECIRTSESEPIEPWLEFLSTESVRTLWCHQRTFSRQVTSASKAYVEEVNDRLGRPCE